MTVTGRPPITRLRNYLLEGRCGTVAMSNRCGDEISRVENIEHVDGEDFNNECDNSEIDCRGACVSAGKPISISMPTLPSLALIGASWICIAVIAYLSLVPRGMEVRTFDFVGVVGSPHAKAIRYVLNALEHALAYSATAALLIKAYPARPPWSIITFLSTYSVALEALQTLSQGRHPGIAGVIWSSVGAVAAGWISSRIRSNAAN